MSATATPSSSGSAVASPPSAAGLNGSGVPFVLYALRGRVYASNVKQKLIDLGRLTQQDDGTWTYLLDGDKSTGAGLDAPEAALQHIAATTTFLFLDGQFTALESLGGVDRPDLQAAPQCDVLLDPQGRGERMIAPRG